MEVPAWITQLANVGGIGAVLGYILLRQEPRLDELRRSVDRLTRAQMLLLSSQPGQPEPVKRQARLLIRELDRSQQTRLKSGKEAAQEEADNRALAELFEDDEEPHR